MNILSINSKQSKLYKLNPLLRSMGQILRTKTSPYGKVIVNLELTSSEALQLKNHAKKIHLFSENLCLHEAVVVEKGVNLGSKFVLIPLSLKSRKKVRFSEVTYQKIETESKVFYIATAKKDVLLN